MQLDPHGPRCAAALTTAPRLGPPTEREDATPVRFAQLVGLLFLAVASAGYLSGVAAVAVVSAGFGPLTAFLNAAFGLCLGCEAYLATRRVTAGGA